VFAPLLSLIKETTSSLMTGKFNPLPLKLSFFKTAKAVSTRYLCFLCAVCSDTKFDVSRNFAPTEN
jgi:hypothetical protein